ncbi:hypothetical protein [Haladaptatus halobius]|uniref:hypothetical protein n=1 Tax=Haladaptatus halobius TaxID=2884875 RepID=UPI001D0ACDB2|nr:hypothetical protein [Haladaptatus halobius]
MPIPYYPSDDPEDEPAPDIDGIVDTILNGGDTPSLRPGRTLSLLPYFSEVSA